MLVTDQPENLPTTNDLDKLKLPASEGGAHPLQIPAIEATFVRFVGTSGELIESPPERKEERTYIVKAVCKGYDIRDRADGEDRIVAVMEIESCYERGKVPIVDEKQPSLFPVQDGDDEHQGGDDE